MAAGINGALARSSTRWLLIPRCAAVAPTLILAAWIFFPLIADRKMAWGYLTWNLACIGGGGFAGVGILCWIAERSTGRSTRAWILFVLIGVALGSLFALKWGAFYWAFERGYFLD